MGPTWVLSAPGRPMLAPWTLLSGTYHWRTWGNMSVTNCWYMYNKTKQTTTMCRFYGIYSTEPCDHSGVFNDNFFNKPSFYENTNMPIHWSYINIYHLQICGYRVIRWLINTNHNLRQPLLIFFQTLYRSQKYTLYPNYVGWEYKGSQRYLDSLSCVI